MAWARSSLFRALHQLANERALAPDLATTRRVGVETMNREYVMKRHLALLRLQRFRYPSSKSQGTSYVTPARASNARRNYHVIGQHSEYQRRNAPLREACRLYQSTDLPMAMCVSQKMLVCW